MLAESGGKPEVTSALLARAPQAHAVALVPSTHTSPPAPSKNTLAPAPLQDVDRQENVAKGSGSEAAGGVRVGDEGDSRAWGGEERGLGNDKWPGSCPRKADERDAIGGDTVMRGTDGLGDWGRAAGE